MIENASSLRDLHIAEFERLLDDAFNAAHEAGEWHSDDEEEYDKRRMIFVQKKEHAFAWARADAASRSREVLDLVETFELATVAAVKSGNTGLMYRIKKQLCDAVAWGVAIPFDTLAQEPIDKAGAAVGGSEKPSDVYDFGSAIDPNSSGNLRRKRQFITTGEHVHAAVMSNMRWVVGDKKAGMFADKIADALDVIHKASKPSPHPDDGSVKGQDQGGGRG